MSDTSQGPGWWQASDGKWYAPELHPSAAAPPPPVAPPVPGQPYPAGQPYGAPVVQARTSGKAVASLVLSIVWISGLGSLLAVIFALLAKRDIRDSNGTVTGGGLATAGLVIGIIGLVGAVVLWVSIIAVGTAVVHGVSVVANCEADATAVQVAAEAYKAQTGSFPPSVEALAQSSNGGPYLHTPPSTSHYTIFVSPTDGTVYVYPPNSAQPSPFSSNHDFTAASPCLDFAR